MKATLESRTDEPGITGLAQADGNNANIFFISRRVVFTDRVYAIILIAISCTEVMQSQRLCKP